ncbi:Assembly factor CBP4 [Nakaseomyces bracarensis]|uniref:Cytochrome b mRNA-processing protein 4 n=1 Tax=Nakaseomyces bracarensis TaxID=273131 RepID=A0ABR4NTP5_9SACH
MDIPVWRRWLKIYAYGGAIILSGVLLFKYTTPSDEKLIASLSPELRLQYEKEKKLRQEEQKELMRVVQETAKSNDPIWKTGPIESPWEKKKGGDNVKNESFFDNVQKTRAEEAQKDELKRIREELDTLRAQSVQKTNEIVTEKKGSSWWKPW